MVRFTLSEKYSEMESLLEGLVENSEISWKIKKQPELSCFRFIPVILIYTASATLLHNKNQVPLYMKGYRNF